MMVARRNALLVFIVTVVLLQCLNGCSSSSSSRKDKEGDRPRWFINPNYKGRIGGVGNSRPHFRGYHMQRMTAISRAIDEIARQKNVRVDTEVETVQTSSQGSSVAIYSKQYTNNVEVSAEVKEWWEDKKTGELFVWMVER